MDRQEATALLAAHLAGLRARSYAELVTLRGEPQIVALQGASGSSYQVEVEILWDGPQGGDLRVVGSIDDGGASAFVPISSDFIVVRPA